MAQILRISIRGILPGGEVWSVNPCWEINGGLDVTVTPAMALTIATAIGGVNAPTALQTAMAPGTAITSYRVEARSLAGVLESQAEFVLPVMEAGSGTVTHPYGTAIVVSLRTPGVGGSSRGRMYWPATGQVLDSATYRISTTNATTLLTGFRSYLNDIETAIKASLPEANLTVWSRTTANFHNVTSLQLGNVLDSQRRRRDALVEGYTAVAFP